MASPTGVCSAGSGEHMSGRSRIRKGSRGGRGGANGGAGVSMCTHLTHGQHQRLDATRLTDGFREQPQREQMRRQKLATTGVVSWHES